MTEIYKLDANVVLRFLTGEPEDMAERSRKLMQRADRDEIKLKLLPLVVAEVYWVLNSYYEFSRERIAGVLGKLIRAQGIETAEVELIGEALELAAEKNVDFIDAILSLRAKKEEVKVVTFDREDFKKLTVEWVEPEG